MVNAYFSKLSKAEVLPFATIWLEINVSHVNSNK